MQKYIWLDIYKLICNRFNEYNIKYEWQDNILYIKQRDVIHQVIVKSYDDFWKVWITSVLIKNINLSGELMAFINFQNTHSDIMTMYATSWTDENKCDVSISCAIIFCDSFDIEAFSRHYYSFVSHGQDMIKEIQNRFWGLTVKEFFKSKWII